MLSISQLFTVVASELFAVRLLKRLQDLVYRETRCLLAQRILLPRKAVNYRYITEINQ